MIIGFAWILVLILNVNDININILFKNIQVCAWKSIQVVILLL